MNDIPVVSALSVAAGKSVADVSAIFPEYTHAEIVVALEAAVSAGLAEKYMLNRQYYYLKKAEIPVLTE